MSKRFKDLGRKVEGAAFTAILMVIVLTGLISLLAVSSMQQSTIQSNIVRNFALKQASFRHSDSAVGLTELQFSNAVSACMSDFTGCDRDISPPYLGEQVRSDAFWVNSQAIQGHSYVFGDSVVEYMGRKPIPGDAERELHFYRVSGRASDTALPVGSEGSTDDRTETIVQSMVRLCARKDRTGTCS